MREMQPPLRIGQVAKLAGVAIDTVRFYEREGLLPRAPRSPAGYRLFPPSSVDRVAFIKKVQGLGFTLTEVREQLRAVDRGDGSSQGARNEIERAIQRIDEKLAEMRRVRRKLVAARTRLDTEEHVIERIAARIAVVRR